jgi:hypothetical protein
MTTTNTTPEATTNGRTIGQPKDEWAFKTAEEARAAGKAAGCSKDWSVWTVARPGLEPVSMWASGKNQALARAAEAAGYVATKADKPVDRDQLAAGLAALSPEERSALLAAYIPAAGGAAGTGMGTEGEAGGAAPAKPKSKGGKGRAAAAGMFPAEGPYADKQ